MWKLGLSYLFNYEQSNSQYRKNKNLKDMRSKKKKGRYENDFCEAILEVYTLFNLFNASICSPASFLRLRRAELWKSLRSSSTLTAKAAALNAADRISVSVGSGIIDYRKIGRHNIPKWNITYKRC